jgi:mannose-6-phosphate isomerase
MDRLFKLQNTVQPYAWGSRYAIAELLGQPAPSDHPQAELWMGAHAKAPSKVWYQGRWQSLAEMIHQDPIAFLGRAVVDRFGPQLPFLLKVLAVDKPLSVQAHPSREMAAKGFARENAEGIALSAPHRNYKDDQHKPECVCALTPFQALCGFRPIDEIIALIEPIWPADRRADVDFLKNGQGTSRLRDFFIHLMGMDANQRNALLPRLVSSCRVMMEKQIAYQWLAALNEAYPSDIGILSPLLLHCIELQPGQALFLPAGRLHAYLNGMAIEIMANSDNVLRGGLTPKHIDVPELLRVLEFETRPLQMLEPLSAGPQELVYQSPVDEFSLSFIHSRPLQPHKAESRTAAPEILLCIEGEAHFSFSTSSKGIDIKKGESIFVPAVVDGYKIEGEAYLYKAAVGRSMIGQK